MKITEVHALLGACRDVNDTLLMSGSHGIGKTEVVSQWAKENDAHLEVLLLSANDIGDLVGMPRTVDINGEIVTVWTQPIWLQRLNDANRAGKRTILFLDELNRAPSDVLNSALQLVLERKIHQHKLPVLNGEETMLIAAINPDGGEYQVNSLDPALLDRFLHVDVEPDLEAWLPYAREKKIPMVIRDFLIENPTRFHFQPQEGSADQVSASPRSWTMLGKHVANFDKIPEASHYQIIKGKVGSAVGSQFYQFLITYGKAVKLEDVEKVAEKAWAKTKSLDETAKFILELTEKMESVQKQEMVQVMIDKCLDKKYTKHSEYVTLLSMLYSLDVEDFMSIFKPLTLATDEIEKAKFKLIVDFDAEANNKGLLKRTLSLSDNAKN